MTWLDTLLYCTVTWSVSSVIQLELELFLLCTLTSPDLVWPDWIPPSFVMWPRLSSDLHGDPTGAGSPSPLQYNLISPVWPGWTPSYTVLWPYLTLCDLAGHRPLLWCDLICPPWSNWTSVSSALWPRPTYVTWLDTLLYWTVTWSVSSVIQLELDLLLLCTMTSPDLCNLAGHLLLLYCDLVCPLWYDWNWTSSFSELWPRLTSCELTGYLPHLYCDLVCLLWSDWGWTSFYSDVWPVWLDWTPSYTVLWPRLSLCDLAGHLSALSVISSVLRDPTWAGPPSPLHSELVWPVWLDCTVLWPSVLYCTVLWPRGGELRVLRVLKHPFT